MAKSSSRRAHHKPCKRHRPVMEDTDLTNLPGPTYPECHAPDVLDNDHPGVQAAADGNPEGWQITLRHLQDTVLEFISQDKGVLQSDFNGRLVYRGENEHYPFLQTSLDRWWTKRRRNPPGSVLGPPPRHSRRYLAEVVTIQVSQLREAGRIGLLDLPNGKVDNLLKLAEPSPISSLMAQHPDVLKVLCSLQHRGCPTNLLDWTFDMNTALYFACRGKQGQAGRVWFLLPSQREWENCRFFASDPNDLRAQAQASLLSYMERGRIIWRKNDQDQVRGVAIPSEHKDDLRHYLFEACGLQYHTLFPDLQGLADRWSKNMVGIVPPLAFETDFPDLYEHCSCLVHDRLHPLAEPGSR